MYRFFVVIIVILVSVGQVLAQDSVVINRDIPPLFKGCDDPLISAKQRQECSSPKILAFIEEHLIYPDSAKVHGIEGLVVVSLLVDTTGTLTDLRLLRNIGYGCGEEALRIVRMMPNFSPAQHDGKFISVRLNLLIRFKKTETAKKYDENLYQIHWGTVYKDWITKKELRNLLKYPLVIRDYYGGTYDIKHLKVQVLTATKTKEKQTKGNNLSPAAIKLLQRARKNQTITLRATILKDYKEIEVVRSFSIKP